MALGRIRAAAVGCELAVAAVVAAVQPVADAEESNDGDGFWASYNSPGTARSRSSSFKVAVLCDEGTSGVYTGAGVQGHGPEARAAGVAEYLGAVGNLQAGDQAGAHVKTLLGKDIALDYHGDGLSVSCGSPGTAWSLSSSCKVAVLSKEGDSGVYTGAVVVAAACRAGSPG